MIVFLVCSRSKSSFYGKSPLQTEGLPYQVEGVFSDFKESEDFKDELVGEWLHEGWDKSEFFVFIKSMILDSSPYGKR